ncbi:Uu.00g103550.m01.CDS01 [Anthostomella pinea]|uniref:Uu.00g103550.m01.CDS01 n=1 Tax=Anthostomella pinea TaxID=933095 RepID=A0AAI8VEL1_9PEZI|nr:Uu.00g103550.m01.CDS01 [Anthostomella pinea]
MQDNYPPRSLLRDCIDQKDDQAIAKSHDVGDAFAQVASAGWPSNSKLVKKNQRWLRPPKKLIYIDETRCLASGSPLEDVSQYQFHLGEPCHNDAESVLTGDAPPSPGVTIQHAHAAPSLRKVDTVLDSPVNQRIRPDGNTSINTSQSLEDHSETEPAIPAGVEALRMAVSPPVPSLGNVLPPTFHGTAALPLKSRTEAILFRHYIQKLAVCLDLCDPLRHFELVVPERASMCHTLLNAVFALAARHLSHTTDFDPLASNRYHDECLNHLIPMLNHASAVSDENLFAATVILRMLEEMDGSTTGHDSYSHLLGIHAFVNVGDQYMIPGSLSAASFWVGLRQEIYIAVITQQPVKVSLDHFIVDRSFEPADDYTWSNRAIVLIADVLNFCFGDSPSTVSRWNSLNEACEKWTMTRPMSFNPFFYRERTSSAAFPEIWHGSSCHVIGIQHHLLAQLFLTQFDPTIPRVGTMRRASTKRLTVSAMGLASGPSGQGTDKRQHRIETILRELCGIGICNQWSPPAMFTACMGIAMFGDQFGERSDQEALADLLRQTEAAHARPTAAIQQQLMKTWGWIPDLDH